MNDTRDHVRAIVAIAAGLGVFCAAHGQETGKVMIDVAECIRLEAPEARLACYESRVAAVFGERAAQAAAARPSVPGPAVAVSPQATVADPAPPTGSATPALTAPPVAEPLQSQNRDDRRNRRENKPQAAEFQATNDIVSRVKELREVMPNAWQITLENGQVWRQTVSKRYGLRAGQQVRIYGTHWGSALRLSADEVNGYIQVERVR